jgi:hypothetical protein
VCSAFGRAVRSFQSCAVFSRYARENRTQKIGQYHAAAGKKSAASGTHWVMRNGATA